MAYKMAPKGDNTAKTGNGIPMTFRQDGPKQMKLIKKIGSAVSSAHEAGEKAYDESRKPASHWGGSGRQTTYEKNPVEYVKGFVGNIMSGESPKPKVKPKPQGPMQKKKEQGFLDRIGSTISNANEAGVKAYDESRKPASHWGGSGRQTTYEKNPVEYVKGFVGNIMSGESPKPKVKPKPKG